MHRGTKVKAAIQAGKARRVQLGFHLLNIEQTYLHFLENPVEPLAYAALGAELAIQDELTVEHLDYSNEFASTVMHRYARSDLDDLRSEILRLRRGARDIIPHRNWLVRQEKMREWFGCYWPRIKQCLKIQAASHG